MVSKILVLALVCLAVVAMAEAAAASRDQGKKEEVELETSKGSGVSDDGFGQGNGGQFTIQLQGGRHVSKPEVWERIVKKDKARAQWIADRLDKASKEKEKKEEAPVAAKHEHNG